jgi:hypothetical protein
MQNGEYIFYADESGDHSLTSVDKAYPIFVLSICGFRKREYCRQVVPNFQRFKFDHFGHDMTICHERDIRKQIGDFSILSDIALREKFQLEMTKLVSASKFSIFPCIIDKYEIKTDLFPDNPYSLALRVCLQNIYRYLRSKSQLNKAHHFIFEKRGDKEDRDLELEFRRIVDGQNQLKIPFDGFQIRFADKRANSTGMQIADLTAHPIGIHFLRPKQENRAYNAVREKIYRPKDDGARQRGIYLPD